MSVQNYTAINWLNTENKPQGGTAYGTGFAISWQNGPLGRGSQRVEPNGAFVETLLHVVRTRIQFYQDNGFDCEENENAISAINEAIKQLESRTTRREQEQTEGTWEGK